MGEFASGPAMGLVACSQYHNEKGHGRVRGPIAHHLQCHDDLIKPDDDGDDDVRLFDGFNVVESTNHPSSNRTCDRDCIQSIPITAIKDHQQQPLTPSHPSTYY